MWNGQRRHAGQRELVTLWRFPNSGCGELDHVTVRVAEIQTARAAFPTYLAQKIDIMFGQARVRLCEFRMRCVQVRGRHVGEERRVARHRHSLLY